MNTPNTGYTMRCVLCGAENSEQETTTYCTECGGVLQIEYDQPRAEIQYPLTHAAPDPLINHPSPLKHLERLSVRYGVDLYAKLEFDHPTGCFKDRGSYVEVQKALELNADAICLASTGNMAASVAAYACYFKIPCYVFVPEKTSDAKIAQATIYNANILRIRGDFSTCEALCRKFAKSGNYYLAGDYVFREEGQKSFSYELVDQGGDDFDDIVVPIGCGTNFAAIWKGLTELKAGGRIDRYPRMTAVQPEHSSPVVEGIMKKEKVIKNQVHTLAESVAAADPVDFHKVLKGIETSGGQAFTVTENEILESLREMAVEEGHFTEPASALPLAAVKNNVDTFKGRKVLLVLTGHGLKDTKTVAKHSLSSPVLANDLEKVIDYINSGYIELQKESWGKSHETVVANFKFDPDHQKMYSNYLDRISKKGKTLSSRETEMLQTMIFNEDADLDYPVRVLDYKVTMHRHGLVKADLKMEINGKTTQTKAEGAGPVDAVLTALKQETDNLLPLKVKNHEVEILSPDTDSLVIVTLTLGYKGEDLVAKAASPDTIEATLDAFLKGIAIAFNREHKAD